MLKMNNKKLVTVLNMNNVPVVKRVAIADTFLMRLKGLLGKSELNEDEGLIIQPCNSIHTFFMKFNLDIAFVDENYMILEIYRNLSPNKFSKIHKDSKFVIEARAGVLSVLKKGDRINIDIVNKAWQILVRLFNI